MKISTQLAVVIAVGVVGFVGLVVGLAVLARWSDGAIIGMATAFGAVIVNTVIAVRSHDRTGTQLAEQDVKLEEIAQSAHHGMTDEERQDVAERAAAAVVRQFRGGTQ